MFLTPGLVAEHCPLAPCPLCAHTAPVNRPPCSRDPTAPVSTLAAPVHTSANCESIQKAPFRRNRVPGFLTDPRADKLQRMQSLSVLTFCNAGYARLHDRWSTVWFAWNLVKKSYQEALAERENCIHAFFMNFGICYSKSFIYCYRNRGGIPQQFWKFHFIRHYNKTVCNVLKFKKKNHSSHWKYVLNIHENTKRKEMKILSYYAML